MDDWRPPLDDSLGAEPVPEWERSLDALVRPALVVAPPPDLQQSILAAVLQATAAPAAALPIPAAAIPTLSAPPTRAPSPIPVMASQDAGVGGVPLVAYALLAAVLVAYVAALSWLHGVFGGAGWVPTLMTQLLTVSELIVGRPAIGEPLTFAWTVLEHAPWIALLPLGWLLWERDRVSARAA